MARKRDYVATESAATEEIKSVESVPATVKILSMREGDIILPGNVILSQGKTVDVDREQADSLLAQFPAHVRIIQ